MKCKTRDDKSDRPKSNAEERLCSRHGRTIYPRATRSTQPR